MSMINNNFNNTNTSNYDEVIPKQFITYVYYELSLFEEITNKKFFFNLLKNDNLN